MLELFKKVDAYLSTEASASEDTRMETWSTIAKSLGMGSPYLPGEQAIPWLTEISRRVDELPPLVRSLAKEKVLAVLGDQSGLAQMVFPTYKGLDMYHLTFPKFAKMTEDAVRWIMMKLAHATLTAQFHAISQASVSLLNQMWTRDYLKKWLLWSDESVSNFGVGLSPERKAQDFLQILLTNADWLQSDESSSPPGVSWAEKPLIARLIQLDEIRLIVQAASQVIQAST